MKQKTYTAKPAEIDQTWWVVDADGQTLGRLATRLAQILRGKHRPTYTPHVDMGDYVVVVNAARVAVTGAKTADKKYVRHSGYPGGLRTNKLSEMLQRWPDRVLRLAVRGMLPRNNLGASQLKKLKIYRGAEHPHGAQRPQPLDLGAGPALAGERSEG
jgi:large subunit ribosomal protein L13